MLNKATFARLSSLFSTCRHFCYSKFVDSSRKTRIIGASALFLVASTFGAAGFAPSEIDTSDVRVQKISTALPLPNLQQQILALEEQQQSYVNIDRIRSGDTLATLLTRLGVNDRLANDFIRSDEQARAVINLRPGQRVVAHTTREGELLQLSTTINDSNGPEELVVTRNDQGFASTRTAAELERRVEMRSGIIRSSLFAATDAAQIPDPVASQVVDMFGTNINFASDLRRGDRFHIVYETFWHDGHPVRTGRVLAGEFHNASNTYEAVWFDDPSSKGQGGYYSMDGKSLKKAFLKSPLAFTRISSGFSIRKHPILGKWKRHTGVDFAAPTGTPIRASGDGTVNFVGVQNGYGNIVILTHWNGYSTAYAHMSRFAKGMSKGTKVSQGDVIGYVGSTGWATGPHLHYEFRVNNQPRDPMSAKIPNAQPLSTAQMQRFKSVSEDMNRRIALLRLQKADDTRLASAQ
jgi:murein DD-endopeptidase MepM/ murein hydrolase activator NlpD